MTLLVTFIEVDDDTHESVGTSWVIEDPAVEMHLRHVAKEHFGEPFIQSTDEQAFAEMKTLVSAGETWEQAHEQLHREAGDQ